MKKLEISEKDQIMFNRLVKGGAIDKRALHIFEYLLLRFDFKDFVLFLRKELHIPQEGYDSTKVKDVQEVIDKDFFYQNDFNGEVFSVPRVTLNRNGIEGNKLVEDYLIKSGIYKNIPSMALAESFVIRLVNEYVVFNMVGDYSKSSIGLASIPTYIGMSENESIDIELRFEVPVSLKKEEMKEYIDAIWPTIEKQRKDMLSPTDLIHFKSNKKLARDIHIFNKYMEIYNLPRTEKKRRGIEYVDLAVISELKKEGMIDVPNDGTIRSIVSRLKNKIETINNSIGVTD